MIKLYISLLIFITSLYAHPHTFIEVYPTANTKDGYIENIKIKWIIDQMTSSMLIMEFDNNNDGKIDINENNYINENYFSTLKKQGYYTYSKYKYKISDFKAQIANNKIEYTYILKLDQKVKIKDFSLSFYDTDFFVSMVLKEKFVNQKIPHLVEGVDGDFYYGYKITYK